MIIDAEDDYIEHYGILRKSGRYPWGSGGDPVQRSSDFISMVKELRSEGLTDKQIYDGFGMSSTDFRRATALAKNQKKQADIDLAVKLREEKQWSTTAIGEHMGIPESTVRTLLAPSAKEKADIMLNVTNMLKEEVANKGVVDVGTGVEHHLNISEGRLKNALAFLEEEGYYVGNIQVDQGNSRSGNKTTVKVLADKGQTYKDLKKAYEADPGIIKTIKNWFVDNGRSILGLVAPIAVDPNRVQVKYVEEGGGEADGMIYLRPGAKDLTMGGAKYSQVRIQVGDSHYLKGMAIYKDDLPDGVDIQFNTNKSSTGNKLDAMKKLNVGSDGVVDEANPFGSAVRQLYKKNPDGTDFVNADGQKELASALNLVNEEGDWEKWRNTISTQVLSKQAPTLARAQLQMTAEQRQAELDDIMSLTNPTVKKKLLEDFADATDTSAVRMDAAALPSQGSHVILPINTLKSTEIYAPNYTDGDTVALIRYPHGGKFEIPVLTVNNRHKDARETIGSDARDAVGINHLVAQQLSGADFDGDTVLVVKQTPSKSLNASRPLKDLEGFDPQTRYPGYEGMPVMKAKQTEMGKISNLITDMTIAGAPDADLARAVKHSMVVIDAEKHKLNYKQSEIDNGISALKAKYQPAIDGGRPGGAATLISRAKSQDRVPEYRLRKASDIPAAKKLKKEGLSTTEIAERMKLSEDSVKSLLKPGASGGKVDPRTGELVKLTTGAVVTTTKTYKRTGETVTVEKPAMTISKKLAEKDPYELISTNNTQIEQIYAAHSSRLKAMANAARKAALETPNMEYSPTANKAYSAEVESLTNKLKTAQANAPLERQARVLAQKTVSLRRQANPDMDSDELRKLNTSAINEARAKMNAKKISVEITPLEWKAIQAGAISDHRLGEILKLSLIHI